MTRHDLTLAYILDHAFCCTSAASSGRSLHLIISQLRKKYSLWNCPNYVRRTKSSIAQLRTGFKMLVPAPFLSSVPLYEITFPFLPVRNPLWTPLGQTLGRFFSQNYRPAVFHGLSLIWHPPSEDIKNQRTMFYVPRCCLYPSPVSVCFPF